MKNKATTFLKRIVTVIKSMAKAKSMALKGKTNGFRTRFLIFSLMRNKKLLVTSISQKLHALMGQPNKDENQEDLSKAIVVYNYKHTKRSLPNCSHQEDVDDDFDSMFRYGYNFDDEEEERYPDLTHSLFDLDDDVGAIEESGGSVIELVKNSKQDQGEEFKLEDEIDHVAACLFRDFIGK